MPEVFEISDQLSRRFSSGCVMCGKLVTWRVKVLDPQNLPLEICVDCLSKQRCIHCKHKFEPKEGTNVRKEDSDRKRVEEPKPSVSEDKETKQPIKGVKRKVGDKLEVYVEG